LTTRKGWAYIKQVFSSYQFLSCLISAISTTLGIHILLNINRFMVLFISLRKALLCNTANPKSFTLCVLTTFKKEAVFEEQYGCFAKIIFKE